VIKCGVIDSPEILEDLEEGTARNGLREDVFLEKIIAAACRIKKQFVEGDERDRGIRRMLNFGHTVGHAVEASSGYRLSHGESVAIGMVAAALLSGRLHGLPAEDALRIEALIRAVGLPVRIPAGINPEEIRSRLNMDKKKEGETTRYVLIKKMGMPFLSRGVPEGVLRETLEAMKP
jgi:3-dehydroquinate synthase